MSGIYLSRIGINDFRTFGEFEIAVPAKPGLVLVTGTNGLGKSSFFDAIEWGLTGNIRRLAPYVTKSRLHEGLYLTRRGAETGSHSVKLTFSDGQPITRGAGTATPLSSIVELLARANRPAISDLGTYLALTHFLGQAAQQRFTSRDPGEQWEALKGPSGIERLEEVRSGLRGRSTTSAFTRRIDAQRSAVSEIERKVADWQGWRARLERLQQAVRASGGLAPEEVAKKAQLLEAELSKAIPSPAPPVVGENASQLIARLSQLVLAELRNVVERKAELENLENTVAEFESAVARSRDYASSVERLRHDRDERSQELNGAAAKVALAEESATSQSAAISALEQRIHLLEAVRIDQRSREGLLLQIEDASREYATLSAAISKTRGVISSSEGALKVHSDASADLVVCREVFQKTQVWLREYGQVIELESKAASDLASLKTSEEVAAAARRDLELLQSRKDEVCIKVNDAAAELAELQRHSSEISAAVATIASHLHDDETKCPVCFTLFDVGQLKALAIEAAETLDVRVAKAASKVEELRKELVPINDRLVALLADVEAPASYARVYELSRSIAAEARGSLARHVGAGPDDSLKDALYGLESRRREELLLAEDKLQRVTPDAAAAAIQLRNATEELESLKASEAVALSHMETLRLDEQACLERISARGMASITSDEVNQRLAEDRASLEVARSGLSQLTESVNSARLRVAALRKDLEIAEIALAEAVGAGEGAKERLKEAMSRWVGFGFSGEPDRERLDSRRAELGAQESLMRRIRDELEELAKASKDALLQEEVREITESMRAVGGESGVTEADAYLEKLIKQLGLAKAELKLSQEAKKAVTSFTELLKRRAENYSSQVLAPLNGIIDEFNDAMLSTPGESINFKADHRVDATTFGMSLRYREDIDAAIEWRKQLPPQVVLSEGQLAANGFSILCAASTAYPWSRWRALLLDDPLQHNDIIHTAAFVDVMRNMVELRGYQLFMSSHDRAESDFIARKFDAAGLPCSRVVLSAPSDRGVVFEGPQYNQAARNALQAPIAALQSSA